MRRKLKKRNNRKAREPLTWRIKEALVRAARAAAVVTSVLFLLFAGSKVYEELLTSPHLEIKAIIVEGTGRLTNDEVIELSGITTGRNILSTDLSEARRMLARHPFVKSAEVKRRLPEKVNIVIMEREPQAFVKVDALYVMDKNGEIFKSYSRQDGLDLPVITGMDRFVTVGEDEHLPSIGPEVRPELLTLIGVLRDADKFTLNGISEIHFDPTYGFSLYTLNEGVRVEIGKDGFARKVSNIKKVLEARGGGLSGIEAIDLTGDRGVVVRFMAGGKKRHA
jgi:cell division protein FtsQ